MMFIANIELTKSSEDVYKEFFFRIRPMVEQTGIFKIIPPAGWNPPSQIDMNNPMKFPTKLQSINTLQEGEGFPEGRFYSMKEYEEMANQFWNSWKEKYYQDKDMTYQALEKDYWDIVSTNCRKVSVEYGNDLDITQYMSGFLSPQFSNTYDDIESNADIMFEEYSFYARTSWNLRKLANANESILKHVTTPINGVNVPWLYVGMLFASFCWHVEDNYLYSINYSHHGDVKQWYGVPPRDMKKFKKVSCCSSFSYRVRALYVNEQFKLWKST
jgi:histone demethylase JARID1